MIQYSYIHTLYDTVFIHIYIHTLYDTVVIHTHIYCMIQYSLQTHVIVFYQQCAIAKSHLGKIANSGELVPENRPFLKTLPYPF